MANSIRVLVAGATGKQGGEVARLLLERGHHVVALTRNPTSPAAQRLAERGASLATGDLDDRRSLERAADDVDAIFAMSAPFEGGPEGETRQGVNLADVAKARSKYLVYTSVGNADRQTGIPHFESKHQVELHLAKIGAEAAIIAPVYFMENLLGLGRAALRQGVYAMTLPPSRKLAQIAVRDIASFAVLALTEKTRFVGKRVNIGSDELTGVETAEILSRAIGRPIQYRQTPLSEMRRNEDAARMYEWFERVGYTVDLPALRRDYPEVGWHTFEAWAREQDWATILGT